MNNRAFLLLGAGVCCLLLAAGAAPAAERGEDLAGETAIAQPEQTAPGVKEPELQAPAAGDKTRPLLKLPEVVVRGDRQFQITAERRDLVLNDPMAGAKEVPMDLAEVSVPGLSPAKDAPLAETITPKDHLFTLEAGGGLDHRAEGRIVAGQELPHVNYIFHGDYAAGDTPRTFGFNPFGQKFNGGLDVHTDLLPGADLAASFSGQSDTNRHPRGRLLGWGDWLERGNGKFGLQGDVDLWNKSDLTLLGSLQAFGERGAPGSHNPELTAKIYDFKADYEQKIQGLIQGEMNLLVSLGFTGQNVRQAHSLFDYETWEALKTLTVTGRLRLISLLHLDLGIRLDDFQGGRGRSAAGIVGQASLVLPTRTVLYAGATPELRWEPVSEWTFRNPYQAVGALPLPEHVYGNYRVGWRQSFGDSISTDVAWFKRDASDTPAWLDPAGTGLFTYANLRESHVEGAQAEAEIHYLPQLYQTFSYTYRSSRAAGGEALPNTPGTEMKTELKLSLPGLETSLEYRYLGDRSSDPAAVKPDLGAAQLVAAKVDLDVSPGWTVYFRLDNLLGAAYQEWRGYPARGASGVAGLRVNF